MVDLFSLGDKTSCQSLSRKEQFPPRVRMCLQPIYLECSNESLFHILSWNTSLSFYECMSTGMYIFLVNFWIPCSQTSQDILRHWLVTLWFHYLTWQRPGRTWAWKGCHCQSDTVFMEGVILVWICRRYLGGILMICSIDGLFYIVSNLTLLYQYFSLTRKTSSHKNTYL